jgi:uncharacterized protein (DUF2141 family)
VPHEQQTSPRGILPSHKISRIPAPWRSTSPGPLRMDLFAVTLRFCPACRRLCVLAAVLSLSLGVAAQTEPPETPDSASPAATSINNRELAGSVVNSVTGEPVRRALVQITPMDGVQRSVLTDGEGRFQFSAVPDSEVAILARKPGFFADNELHPDRFLPTMVHPGGAPFVLQLLPEGVITGHITNTKGEPIEDSPVRILKEKIVDGRKRWEAVAQANCDEDGQFRVAGLVPGKYFLSVGPNLPGGGHMLRRSRPVRQEGFGLMFYPGVSELEAASPIVIAGGEQVQTDFALKGEPIFRVSGTVGGIPPNTGPELQFLSKSGDVVATPLRLDVPAGKFEAAVPAGSYIVQLRGLDFNGQVSAVELPIVVSSDMDGLSLVLGPAITVPVNVVLHASGTRREQADTIRVGGREQAFSMLSLVSTENRADNNEFPSIVTEQGTVAFHNLLPGRYAIRLASLAPWYVRSATSGTTDLLREDLVLTSGRRPEPIEIVFQDDGCGVHGLIRMDGQAAAGTVVLLPDRSSLAYAQTSVTTTGAEFYFAGLAPGDYKLLAFDSVEGVEFRNPEALAPYLSKAVALSLQPNEVANVNVERISTAK